MNPSVSRKPGSTRVDGRVASNQRRSGPVDLIERPTIGEMGFLGRLPPTERLVDGEQLHLRERRAHTWPRLFWSRGR